MVCGAEPLCWKIAPTRPFGHCSSSKSIQCNCTNLDHPRCVNSELVRPPPPTDDSPSTACNTSSVHASGGVRLGKAKPPCFGAPPGISQVPSRRLPPPPSPPSSSCSSNPAANAAVYPMQQSASLGLGSCRPGLASARMAKKGPPKQDFCESDGNITTGSPPLQQSHST